MLSAVRANKTLYFFCLKSPLTINNIGAILLGRMITMLLTAV